MKTETYSICPFDRSPEDYQGVIAVIKKTWTDSHGFGWTDNLQRQDEQRPTSDPVVRHVARSGDKIIAYGEIIRRLDTEDEQAYYLNITVGPEHRNKGIGSALFNLLIDLLEQKQASQVFSGAEDNDPQSISFLTNRDFTESMRIQLSTLDVARFDPSRFSNLLQKVEEYGIRFRSIAEIKESDPAWLEKLWKLDTMIQKDTPLSFDTKQLNLQEFEEQNISSDWFDPNNWIIALDVDQWVGETALRKLPWVNDRYGTQITGVAASHRRRGIATALKLKVITQVKNSGAKYIQTINDELNPMYNINLVLGFSPEPTIVLFRRTF